jgi:hypothetical protein
MSLKGVLEGICNNYDSRQSSQRPLAVLDFVDLRVTQIIFYFKKSKFLLSESYLEKD